MNEVPLIDMLGVFKVDTETLQPLDEPLRPILSRCAFPQGGAVCNRPEALEKRLSLGFGFKPGREPDAQHVSETWAIWTWLLVLLFA